MKHAIEESLQEQGLLKEEQIDSGGDGGGLVKEEQIDSGGGGYGGDGGVLVKEEPTEQLNGLLQRMEQRAVANSLAQIDARDAVEASGWPEGSAEFDARDDIAMQREMQLAMEQAALDVRKRYAARREQRVVKQEPTEQQPAVPIVKEEQPAPPTNKFGGLGEFKRFRVRHGNRAPYVTSNQIQGAIHAEDLTRTPPPRRRGAEPVDDPLKAALDELKVPPLTPQQADATHV
jgi:hypothetical protein